MWQSLLGRRRAKGEARARQARTFLAVLWTATSTQGHPRQLTVGLPDSECSRQWTWYLGPAGKTQALLGFTHNSEEAGEVPAAGWQGNQAAFDIFFCKLSPGSAAAVLALGFMPNSSCSCPRTGCELSPGASYPPARGTAPHLLTSVSPLFIGLFTGRAMTGKKKRELRSLLCTEGRA